MLLALLLAWPSVHADAADGPHPFSISRLEFEALDHGLQLDWWIQARTIMEEPEVAFQGSDLWTMSETEAATHWPEIRVLLEEGFTLRVDGEAWQPSFEEFRLEENGATLKVSALLALPARPESLEVRLDHFFDGANPEHTVDMEVRGFAPEPERWFLMWGKREAQFPIPPDPNAPPPPDPFWSYLGKGRDHVLGGVDHLAFVAALLFGVASFRTLLAAVTAFTLSHSITLALGAFDVLRLSPRWVEPGISLSISAALWWHVWKGPQRAHAWRLAFLFGLLHGSSFATQLRELAEDEVLMKLLGFNLGVELGQLLFVVPVVLAMLAAGRLLGPERVDGARRSIILLLGGFALVLFGRSLHSYTNLRIDAMPEALAPLPGVVVLAVGLALALRGRLDPAGRAMPREISASLGLAVLYSLGSWFGS